MASTLAKSLVSGVGGLAVSSTPSPSRQASTTASSLRRSPLLGSRLGTPGFAGRPLEPANAGSSIVMAAAAPAADSTALDMYDEDTEREYANFFGERLASPVSAGGGDDEDEEEADRPRRGREPRGREGRARKARDSFDENVVQVSRVTKVVKGGKQLAFRAVVVVGDHAGQVGVGTGKAKEVINAVAKAGRDARRNLVQVPITKYKTFPHRSLAISGSAQVLLRTAPPGTGVIAGGAVRTVLEMAGIENAFGKQIGSSNPLNNARATVEALDTMHHFKDVARQRGVTMEHLLK